MNRQNYFDNTKFRIVTTVAMPNVNPSLLISILLKSRNKTVGVPLKK
jgi:hypothetical protein